MLEFLLETQVDTFSAGADSVRQVNKWIPHSQGGLLFLCGDADIVSNLVTHPCRSANLKGAHPWDCAAHLDVQTTPAVVVTTLNPTVPKP